MSLIESTPVTRSEVDDDFAGMEMVAVSAPMQVVFQCIRRYATVDAPVLVTGESGTGKELAVRAIHERSRRAGGPFIAINCGAVPTSLIQSELFGHAKGAFTGAGASRMGRIEAANGGTIFLDEIGDITPELQVSLLRFLQQGTIQRLGCETEIPVDVRVIAATHVDLERAVRNRTFREDLYFRLNVLHLSLPPLRERGEDIEVIGRYYLEKFSRESDRAGLSLSEDAVMAMRHYRWPGNIRELINRIHRAVVMCEGKLVTSADLGLGLSRLPSQPHSLSEILQQVEMSAIQAALKRTGANVTEAARELKISRPKLYRLISKYRLSLAE